MRTVFAITDEQHDAVLPPLAALAMREHRSRCDGNPPRDLSHLLDDRSVA